MAVKSYTELLIWKKAIQITKGIYTLVRTLPKEELYGLSDQMRRSSISIASNIAEGQERNTTTEFIRFLSIAQGSRAELETQLIIGKEIGYFREEDINPLMEQLSELGKMTNSLITTIKNK